MVSEFVYCPRLFWLEYVEREFESFGYEVTYRRALNVQARLLARAIQGDTPNYPPFCTR